MKKALAFILALCMVLSCVSVVAFAENGTNNSTEKNTTENNTTETNSTEGNYTKSDNLSYPEFAPEAVLVDDVLINVYAPSGVFPEGASLSVSKVNT